MIRYIFNVDLFRYIKLINIFLLLKKKSIKMYYLRADFVMDGIPYT